MSEKDLTAAKKAIDGGSLRRQLRMHERSPELDESEAANLRRFYSDYQATVERSLSSFLSASGPGIPDLAIRGPMSVFGYDYLSDKLGAERTAKLRLLEFHGLRGAGGDYAYEVLNLARRGVRASDIRNTVSAIYGPVPLDLVVEYLRALKEANVISNIP